ncbi:hypothetical protein JKP88DRAFT_250985 [Tribonema minus]|uniref:Uncharacterized protein n=1 Tax=Tribonema minus TaxID=303371 RepID=A0A835ZED9_9STRA|nr:hypothetical protein JKP88DRAFT_250985 [Tribonema minus]
MDLHASSAAAFQTSMLARIDCNSVPVADMAWESGGELLWDCKGVYARVMPFMTALAMHNREADVVDAAGAQRRVLIVATHKSEYIKDPRLLRMLRAYCHCGLVLYGKRESATSLLRRYMMCDMFGLEEARDVVQVAIRCRLDPLSAFAVFDSLAGTILESSSLATEVADFLRRRAVEALARAKRCTDATLCSIAKQLRRDDVNCTEPELMEALYGLCLRRCKGNLKAAADLMFAQWDEGEVGGGEKRERVEGTSLWDCVRVSGLSPQSIIAFRTANPPGALSDEFLMSLVQAAVQHDGHGPKARRKVHSAAFPCVIPVSPSASAAFAWRALAEPGGPICYFVALPFAKNDSVCSPPLVVGSSALRLHVTFGGVHVSASLTANEGICDAGEDDFAVQLEVVNFRHDRWRRESSRVGGAVPRLLAAGTLSEPGYLFDPARHPHMYPDEPPRDPHLLVKVTATKWSG